MLNSLSSSWPFAAWGIYIIGEIRPIASNGHKYMVVAIDYFSRWIETESFGTLKAKQMAKFIEKSLICRYGVPHHIVTDNSVQF